MRFAFSIVICFILVSATYNFEVQAGPKQVAIVTSVSCAALITGLSIFYIAHSAGKFDRNWNDEFVVQMKEIAQPPSPVKVDFFGQAHWSDIGEFRNEDVEKVYESQRSILYDIKDTDSNRPIFEEALSTDLRKSDWDYIEEHLKPADWNDNSKIKEIGTILGKPEIVKLYVLVRKSFRPVDLSLEFLYEDQRLLLAQQGAARVLWALTGRNVLSAEDPDLNTAAVSSYDKAMKSGLILTPYRAHQYRLAARRDREIFTLKSIYKFETSKDAEILNGEPILIYGNDHKYEVYQNPYVNVRRHRPN